MRVHGRFSGFIRIAIAGLAAGVAPAANAATTTATFTTSAVINSSCTVSATDLSFGNYLSTAVLPGLAVSTITVFCPLGTSFNVALNAGSAAGSTLTTRRLASGGSSLTYNLYTTASLTNVFGDGTTGTSLVGGTGLGFLTGTPVVVFGAIPIGQDLSTGSYSSMITVTVSY